MENGARELHHRPLPLLPHRLPAAARVGTRARTLDGRNLERRAQARRALVRAVSSVAMDHPEVRTQSEYVPLTKDEFRARFYERFYDPAFDAVTAELEKVFELAWNGYVEYRKTPRTARAGEEFAHPEAQLPIEWLKARADIRAAEQAQKDPRSRSRILVIAG